MQWFWYNIITGWREGTRLVIVKDQSSHLVRIYLFLKIYDTSEGAVSHNVLYYQQLSNARFGF